MKRKYINLYTFGILSLMATSFITSCNELEGDNSDFDFEDKVKVESIDRVPNTIRMATYNVHRCAPANSSVANYDMTANAIKLLNADVVALQELDKGTKNNPVNQIEELAKRNGYKPYFCKAVDMHGGEYGVGIMSKVEPLSTYSEKLPGDEPRVFFVCEFDDFVFIATHLCVANVTNRQWSYDLINSYVKKVYTSINKPVFLAGDLNDTSLPSNCLDNWQPVSASSTTFFSSSKRLDYILHWKGNETTCEVVKTMVPRIEGFSFYEVSDHLPVIVDIAK